MNQLARLKLRNHDFSIICNNCVAWGIYQTLKLKYSTPTIGLFFWSDDYLSFLEQLPKYLTEELRFKKHSKYPNIEERRKNEPWPIGVLGTDIEIQFSHYRNELEAKDAWHRRVKRVNLSNLFVMCFDKYGFETEHYERFQALQFRNKLLFVSQKRRGNGVIYMPEFDGVVGWCNSWLDNRVYEKYLDVIKWLNGQPNYLKGGCCVG